MLFASVSVVDYEITVYTDEAEEGREEKEKKEADQPEKKVGMLCSVSQFPVGCLYYVVLTW